MTFWLPWWTNLYNFCGFEYVWMLTLFKMAVSWISSGMPAMPKYSQEFPVSRKSCGMPWWTNDGLFVVCILCKQILPFLILYKFKLVQPNHIYKLHTNQNGLTNLNTLKLLRIKREKKMLTTTDWTLAWNFDICR